MIDAQAINDATAEMKHPHQPATAPPASLRDRWSPMKKQAFDILAPCALCVVGTDGPVSIALHGRSGEIVDRIGGNAGVWPLKTARTASWRDTTTATYNRGPLCFVGTQFRLWAVNAETRDAIDVATQAIIRDLAERDGCGRDLLNGFADVGPSLDLGMLELEIHAIAARMHARIWDDGALGNLLDRAVARVTRRLRKGQNAQHADLERAIAIELGV